MTDPKKPTVLIVDDVPENLQVLGNMLKKLDCLIAVAMNGQQALDTVARFKPDIILLDVMMPVMDGHEVCRRLKKSDETKDIPVIFLTAKTDPEDIIEGFKLGAVDYVTKPFIGSELLARVKTHISLKNTRQQLAEEVAAKNKFFSIISHDLRGSFGLVQSLTQILTDNGQELTKEEFSELIGDIASVSTNTLELLENLLEWARSQTGTIKFEPEEIDLASTISEGIKSSIGAARKKEISLKSSVNKADKVFADKNMVQLVVRNLVSNAVKFTPNGGNISIHSDKIDNFLKISVVDNGLGIAPEKIDKLFCIDKKVSTNGTNNEQGNGLGLILCKEFVKRNGGELDVESQPKKGTKFSFTLPVP